MYKISHIQYKFDQSIHNETRKNIPENRYNYHYSDFGSKDVNSKNTTYMHATTVKRTLTKYGDVYLAQIVLVIWLRNVVIVFTYSSQHNKNIHFYI